MKRFHIVGRKNSGKTTLVADLVTQLATRGLRVATIKHTHHRHELDTPGKDSWQHRHAGAAVVGILSRGLTAVFIPENVQVQTDEPGANSSHAPNPSGHNSSANPSTKPVIDQGMLEDRYEKIDPLFADCDLLLVEGNLATKHPKVEVWRAATGTTPLCLNDPGISVVVSDDDLPTPQHTQQLPRADLNSLIEWMLNREPIG